MDSQILSIIAGIAWVAIKDGVKLTYDKLREVFKGKVVENDECKKILEILNSIPPEYKLNEKLVEGYLESNSKLMDLLSSIVAGGNSRIVQCHTGSGDNVGGDKIVVGNN